MNHCLLFTKALRSVLPALLLLSNSVIEAQNVKPKNTIPPFNILLTNLKYLKATDLPKEMLKMIVYFDPTCDHCKKFTGDLLQHHNDFKNVQIIMISYTPMNEIKKFESDFNLTKYPNIKVGTEGYTFVVQRYYNIQKFPFIVVFDKKGILLKSYTDAPSINVLLNTMKNKQPVALH